MRFRLTLSHGLIFILALTLGMFLCSLAPLAMPATTTATTTEPTSTAPPRPTKKFKAKAALHATSSSTASSTTTATTTTAASTVDEASPANSNAVYCDDTYGDAWLEKLRTSGASSFCAGTLFTSAAFESPLAMLELRNVAFDFQRITLPRPETRAEADEYFGLQPGAVRAVCRDGEPVERVPHLAWDDKSRSVSQLLSAVAVERGEFERVCRDAGALVVDAPTLLVQRFEYANMYHQLTDWLNSELALDLLELDGARVRVEFFDGHQKSSLDDVWKFAFDRSAGGVQPANHALLPDLHMRLRHGTNASVVCYRRLVMPSPGYASRLFLNAHRPDPCTQPSPLHARLRQRVLRAFGVGAANAVEKPRRCVAIVRRDYVSHPRNQNGVISRKFADEGVIARAAAAAGIECQLVDLAQISVAEQVRLVADAAILFGVHGAGLSLAFLLPPTATLIEARVRENSCHFENIARFAGVRYIGFSANGHMAGQAVGVSEAHLASAFRAAITHQSEEQMANWREEEEVAHRDVEQDN